MSQRIDVSPYSQHAVEEILERGKAEYAKLARSAKEQKRIAEGIGKDWQDGLHIDN